MQPSDQKTEQPLPQQPQSYQGAVPNTQQPVRDPGSTLAIIGVILAFIFTIAGLVVSIIARNKSRAAGFRNTLATVGIWLNASLLVISLLLILPIVVFIVYPAMQRAQQEYQSTDSDNPSSIGIQHEVKPGDDLYNGIAELDNIEATRNAIGNAEQVKKRASAYFTRAGVYPSSISEFSKYSESSIPSTAIKHISYTKPTATSGIKVFYQYCSSDSAQVLYYDKNKATTESLGIGTLVDGSPSCQN